MLTRHFWSVILECHILLVGLFVLLFIPNGSLKPNKQNPLLFGCCFPCGVKPCQDDLWSKPSACTQSPFPCLKTLKWIFWNIRLKCKWFCHFCSFGANTQNTINYYLTQQRECYPARSRGHHIISPCTWWLAAWFATSKLKASKIYVSGLHVKISLSGFVGSMIQSGWESLSQKLHTSHQVQLAAVVTWFS